MIKEIAGRLLHYNYDDVEIIKTDRVYVKVSGDKKIVGGASRPQIARALTLLAKNADKGDFEITQSPCFDHCGVMLDVSRNGVMRVEAVCEYISYMALHGLNVLKLYMEDVFELEGYPYFGYPRGRYTLEELKRIDDFADSLGIEVIPCVQTLGHLSHYLKWQEAKEIRDTSSVLLCGEEKTYTFIDAIIKTMRAAFRTKYIHIGMDEAHDVGLGTYLHRNGFHNRYEILNHHLKKVVGICDKYGFTPMMWSDMYFRINSKTDDYYDCESYVPEEVIPDIPEVGMVYWDYYSTDKSFYKNMIQKHKKMKKPIIFAGGIWTWSGLMPDIERTFQTMLPGLQACCEEGIRDVFATCWGDDGCETNGFFSIYGLSLFSEFCYQGNDVSESEIRAMGEFVSGFHTKAMKAIETLYLYQKRLVWCDIFYNLTAVDWERFDFNKPLEQAIVILKNESGDRTEFYEFAAAVLEVVRKKALVLSTLRSDYKAQKSLREFSKTLLPSLYQDYEKLYQLHLALWKSTYKTNGWEVISARYGAAQKRIQYAIEIIDQYETHQINRIEELEQDILYGDLPTRSFQHAAFTS